MERKYERNSLSPLLTRVESIGEQGLSDKSVPPLNESIDAIAIGATSKTQYAIASGIRISYINPFITVRFEEYSFLPDSNKRNDRSRPEKVFSAVQKS
ncbi:hypothetical protein [Porphyromonas gingivalis]|uniref:hypothetical protein n=1 Tax=Porphyromonas gingivalis TaxID=837 RepID=UPI001F32CFAE|nr:hypothetical protein [Porphyromonas gingivalis]MCE8164844.1 hypothetical protein [Porphyromonas gingivalis]